MAIPFFENNSKDFFVIRRDCFPFPLHLHTQLELAAVWEGTLEIETSAGVQTLNPGDLAIFFPNTPHGYGAGGRGVFQMLLCDPRHAGEFQHVLTRSPPALPVVRAETLHREIPLALRALEEAEPGDAAASLWLQLLLCRLLPALAYQPESRAAGFDLTRRGLGYLSAHYREPLSLDQLAREIHAGKYQLSRLFSAKLHTSFRDYVNRLRVQDAQRALLCTESPITDICYDCGFESQRTFNRVFLAQYGVSPRDYRTAFAKTAQKNRAKNSPGAV